MRYMIAHILAGIIAASVFLVDTVGGIVTAMMFFVYEFGELLHQDDPSREIMHFLWGWFGVVAVYAAWQGVIYITPIAT